MKRLTLIMLLCLMAIAECAAQKIKVACVGNSITYGAYVANREQNAFPVQLQAYLGDGYEVQNFGVSATTALYKGLYPYVDTEKYGESLAYNPDIVIIKLGTNDANERNDAYRSTFAVDYRRLVDVYRNLPSHPKVILLTPVRCFLESNQDKVIEQEIIPVIEQTAYERDLDIINLHNLFGDKWEQYLMTDRLHPSSIGAGMLAEKIYRYFAVESTHTSNIIENFPLKPTKEFNFHGYKGYQYDNNGVSYYIVKPYHTAKGNPWVWRARFWGHEPQLDIELLEQGFHLTYCDVADLFGSPAATKRWDDFYALAVKAGLNKKAVLEGMSRGGLIIYNWAAKNTDKVACIYGDAPVMDIKSWPMHWGNFGNDKSNCERMLKAYGFTDKEQTMAWEGNPIDHARIFAKAKTPIIHVVGDIDTGVPVAENTAIFEQRLQQYGHTMHVIHKPNVGHHPHSLNNPEPILKYILEATGHRKNMCTYPIPGNEYRSAAGWCEGSDWHTIAKDLQATIKGREVKLLMLGNSITQGLGGRRKLITSQAGKSAMDSAVGSGCWENGGISGDRTQHLLWRLQQGHFKECHAEVVILTIGINNINAGDNAEDVAQGIIACAEEARRQMPNSRIITLGLLPAGKAGSQMRKECDRVHAILKKSRIKGVEYVNPTEWFTLQSGDIDPALYGGDMLHLSNEGYKMWAEKIAELIK